MLQTPPAHWADATNWPKHVNPLDAIPDISFTLAAEAAGEWDLDLGDIGTRVMVWGHIERHAHEVVCRALGQLASELGNPGAIDWDRVAQLTNQPDATTARTHYPLDPDWWI